MFLARTAVSSNDLLECEVLVKHCCVLSLQAAEAQMAKLYIELCVIDRITEKIESILH